MGGGIFIYEALVAAATPEFPRPRPQTKHIILFADAADSEEPGDYKTLIEKMRDSDITVRRRLVSVRSTTAMRKLLKDIAKRGWR